MKKNYLVIIAIGLCLFMAIGELILKGWIVFPKNTDTPRQFLNHTTLSETEYLTWTSQNQKGKIRNFL